MNPKNFKCPFTWKDRRPIIHDRVLFVPEYFQAHGEWQFPGWESPEVFGRKAPIELEFCTGNGAWIIDKALAHPEKNWVAVELQFERVRKIWSKMRNENITNLLIVCGDALTYTRYYVPDHSFDAIYVNFPDPWPKEKHAKKRLLQEPFISEMARVIRQKANVTIVTDHPGYRDQVIKAFVAHPHWRSLWDPPFYIHDIPGYGTSYFDTLWREMGIPIHYLQFTRDQT